MWLYTHASDGWDGHGTMAWMCRKRMDGEEWFATGANNLMLIELFYSSNAINDSTVNII